MYPVGPIAGRGLKRDRLLLLDQLQLGVGLPQAAPELDDLAVSIDDASANSSVARSTPRGDRVSRTLHHWSGVGVASRRTVISEAT